MEPKPELQGPMPGPYHVFINHRGPDVKNSLASLLYVWLRSYHLRVFLDKNEIRTGDTISDTIRYAIQSASVNIAIFSQRYAESTWCLDELLWMLSSHHERHRKVIPVFYDVKPTDLRHIDNGCYKNAFEDHQRKGRVSNEEMEKWRNALNEASNLSGIEFKTEESDHGELLDKIVGIVLKEVFKSRPLEVAKYPVGLEQAAEVFSFNEIQKQSELNQTMIVGIVGMSGAGKSTLAKYLYNLRRPNFNGRSCFLSEVRKKDLASLQGKLLRDVFGYSRDLPIDEEKHNLRHCRILLVLDDVDHIDQIDGLLDMDSVGCGSLILITSRDKDLLRRSSPKIVLYNVKPLSRQHARELFCQHAFRQSKPSQEFDDLVEDFLEICKGLPLSLKVLGGQLLGFSDREHWKRQLAMFSTTLHNDIIKTLKVGYDALDDALDKEVFLDVGCFLMGEETELAIRVLNGLYGSNIVHSLERLHQKCLLDFHYDVQSNDEIQCRKQENRNIGYNDLSLQYRGYKLTMHDQLRELARHIAREQFRVFQNPHTPLRLSSSDDILQLCNQDKSNTPSIWGIRNTKEKPPDFRLLRGERVRLLVLEFRLRYLGELVSPEISGDLVWLRLRNVQFDSMRFLLSTSVRSLTVLELESYGESIEEFFKILMHQFMGNPDKAPSRLNELNINILYEPLLTASSSRSTFDAGPSTKSSESYISSPVQQGGVTPIYLLYFLKWIGLENLFKMVLTNLTSLQSLRIDSGSLPSLRHLDLSGCTNLKELPKSFSKLMQLQHLALRECKNLSIPLEILGEISTLEYVDFEGCDKLVALPQGIPYQRHLRYLNLLFTRLSELPENLERLGNLEQLRIGSPELRRLPLSVANLKGLTELIVIRCRHLQCLLPEGISAPNIKILTIDCCPIANFSFEKDQGTMGVLRDLNLKKTSICEICMVDGVFPWLQTIDLSENIMLKQVIALPSALVRINLGNCWELKTLKNLSNLVNLKFLNINGCFELETLSVEGLVSLEEIEAERCWKLERIEGLSSLKRLKCLKIATDNEAFWADICTLSSHELPNFIFAGKVDEGGRLDRYTVGQETATFPPSSPKASEESCLAINSECFSHSVGLETATFLASCGILSKAWEESCLAINSESYSLNEYEGVAYVAFPSFHKIEHYNVRGSKYGEGNLQTDNNVFSGCFKGNNDQPAFVHQGALKLLLHIMENTDFQAKVQIYTDSEPKRLKPIIFVGHSLGGAVATLATLWVLEKRQSSPFCITFGSPLVGDVRLLEAVGRENWEGNFCHVVSKNDIVPRMLLAPFESTAEPLNFLLPYWWGKITNARNDQPDSFIQHAYKTLHQSVMNSATSPYKPLGTYMFCSSHGAACISSSETVLEMLRLTMQSQEALSDKIVQDYLLEHIRYGSVLGEIIENSIRGARILNSEPYEMGISLQLEAIGVGAQNDHARIALQEAENIENKHNTNVAQLAVELSQQQCSMAQLEWYKERCEEEDLFYYDSFKIYMDTDAASPRERLARFWNDIMEKWERQELPSNFPSQIEWINAGTAYRRLVEPLDIAHYYRMSKGKEGNYLSDGRPTRHKVLQKWMEAKEKAGSTLIKLPSLSRDSCFCARLEEALKDFESLKQGQYQRLQSLEMFENYVTKMIDEGSISSDVIARIKADSNSIPSSSEQPTPLQVLSIKVSPSTIS